MVNFYTLATFFLAWGIISVVGVISILSTADNDFTSVTDEAFSGQSTVIDNPPFVENSGGIGMLLELPGATVDWVNAMAKAATFQAPFWNTSWANPIRWVLATIGAAFIGVIFLKGLELLRG